MKKLAAILVLFLAAACEPAPSAYTPEPFNFGGELPIKVNVAEVRVIESYQAPLRAPNVEHEFPTPPAVAMKQWIKQRVFAVGTSGVLEITIDDASVKEVELPKTKGIKGLFTDDQEARYDAHLSATFNLYDGQDALAAATANVSVQRSRSIHEKATIDERERMFDGMTHDMMGTFDAQASSRLRQYFAAYLK